jgi:hypothetical protein
LTPRPSSSRARLRPRPSYRTWPDPCDRSTTSATRSPPR